MNRHNPYDFILRSLREHININNDDDLIGFLEGLRPTLRNLRIAYRTLPVQVNYNDDSVKSCYLLAYYPFYIEIIYRALTNDNCLEFFLREDPEDIVKVSFWGAGPAPEALGLLSFLRDNRIANIQPHFYFFEKYNTWHELRHRIIVNGINQYWEYGLTYNSKICDIFNCPNCFHEICERAFQECRIFVIQNLLNDVIYNYNSALAGIKQIINHIQNKSLLVIIDLNYIRVQDAIRHIEDYIVQNNIGTVIRQVGAINQFSPCIFNNDFINEHFYSAAPYMWPKSRTRYYSSVMLINGIDID